MLFVKGHLPLQLWVEKQNEHGPFNQDSSIAVELAQVDGLLCSHSTEAEPLNIKLC